MGVCWFENQGCKVWWKWNKLVGCVECAGSSKCRTLRIHGIFITLKFNI